MLSNPLNVTLLTSQLLSAPAIWHSAPPLQVAYQTIGVFNSASIRLVQRDLQNANGGSAQSYEGLPAEDWVKSVIKGADERSPRWKHLLVIGGLLMGFEKERAARVLPSPLRRSLEAAVVMAANLALESDAHGEDRESLHVVLFVLGHVFDLLSDYEKSRLDCDRILPAAVEAVFSSRDGLYSGYFIGTMDMDILQGAGNKFYWSPKSSTYLQVQRIMASPMIAILGSLSRVIAFCIGAASQPDLIYQAAELLQRFSRSVAVQWQQNKLSEVDMLEEADFFQHETLHQTLPTFWRLLQSSLFSTVVIQSALLSRLISDPHIPAAQQTKTCIQILHTLRNLYFITVRLGPQLFSQHTFVYNGSIDILSQHSRQATQFLESIRPSEFGRIPRHPYARLMDLYFLNTAERFTLSLSLSTNKSLLLDAAAAYTGTGHDPRLVDMFEAAHSLTLAVFCAPQNHAITIEAVPDYLSTLFHVFPHSLSARQFRLAIKTLVQVACAPGPVSATQPLLGSVIMEMVYSRALAVDESPLPVLARQHAVTAGASASASASASAGAGAGAGAAGAGAATNPIPTDQPTSSRSALILTLIDALSVLSLSALEEWLPLTAHALNTLSDSAAKAACRARFWEVLNNGEMDVARAHLCVTWWTTRAGRESVMFGLPLNVEPDSAAAAA